MPKKKKKENFTNEDTIAILLDFFWPLNFYKYCKILVVLPLSLAENTPQLD
jgi:hypothetical protein